LALSLPLAESVPAEGIESPPWDAVAEIAQSVRVPAVFRPQRPRGRATGQEPFHAAEWLGVRDSEPSRALLEPVVAAVLRQSTGEREAVGGPNIPRQTIASATFGVLPDCAERPEHLLAVDVDDAEWCLAGLEGACRGLGP